MKAIVCTKYGPPEVLKLMHVEKPVPNDNEVLIKVFATTVTAGDCRMRGFDVPLSYRIPARFALGITKPRKKILGMEIAGEIVAVGNNVSRFNVGDQVCAGTGMAFGGYAEYCCLAENAVIAFKPSNLSYEEAVSINIGGRTALYFLKKANIQAGHKVLIYGASGSVGTYAVQLAKHFGAEVTAVCSTTNIDLVKSLNADKVVDYTNEDFTQNGEKYDIIFETVGKTSISKSIKSLTTEGVFLHAVAAPGTSMQLRLLTMHSKKRVVGGGPPSTTDDLILLYQLAAKKKINPVIDRRYRLEEMAEAHSYVNTGRKKGNVIILVADHSNVP